MRLLGFGKKEQYRIGLALSGGGARGFAHAGAIKALLEVGIRPDIVAGVSAGSVVAALYAAGRTPEEMVSIFDSAGFRDFAEFTVPRDGVFSLDRFREFLRANLAPYTRIEQLPVKTVIGVTDLDHGVKHMFEEGPLVDIVAASCSIPIVFKPAVIDGHRYVDGGVTANLPAWTLRDRCKYLIGINCSPLVNRRPKNTIISIAMRSYELMAKNNALLDCERCDMLVRTDELAGHLAFDLSEIDKVFETGYRDTMNHLLYYGFRRRQTL